MLYEKNNRPLRCDLLHITKWFVLQSIETDGPFHFCSSRNELVIYEGFNKTDNFTMGLY